MLLGPVRAPQISDHDEAAAWQKKEERIRNADQDLSKYKEEEERANQKGRRVEFRD